MERKPLASHNCVICYMHTECMRCIALSGLDNNKEKVSKIPSISDLELFKTCVALEIRAPLLFKLI